MALTPRELSRRNPETERQDPTLTQGPHVHPGEGTPGAQRGHLHVFQSSSSAYVRKELQRLQQLFHMWLQPETHSKEEMISQMVIEQFLMNENCQNRSTLKEIWASSGRDLEKFLESLDSGCMEPPKYVHVCMQGQEALFGENIPLRDVIVHLRKQSSARIPTGENMGAPFQPPQDSPERTGQGRKEKEDHLCLSSQRAPENDSAACHNNHTPLLWIIQEDHKPEERDAEGDMAEYCERAGPGAVRSQAEPLEEASHAEAPVAVEPACIRGPDLAGAGPAHQGSQGKPPGGGSPGKLRQCPKPHKCGDCPKSFKYLSQLEVHQRRHRNERPFVCPECHKGFFQASDLHMHQLIHRGEKPFQCGLCSKSFSHRTNLLAHERIHTGEKPYECSLCRKSYRQSSTYHRHMRNQHKVAASQATPSPGCT
ncbi:zinc finger and SCAN domain-containing protein 4 [Tenrec ecaudatus]|uniref:zinc finger and SCAN domain-containing protein 4 n=1 Tax=Tenrec ecaudatus TaxID=94439 RepID=UPI003F5A272A